MSHPGLPWNQEDFESVMLISESLALMAMPRKV